MFIDNSMNLQPISFLFKLHWSPIQCPPQCSSTYPDSTSISVTLHSPSGRVLCHGGIKHKCSVLGKENFSEIRYMILEQNQLNSYSGLYAPNFIYSLSKDPTFREKLHGQVVFLLVLFCLTHALNRLQMHLAAFQHCS